MAETQYDLQQLLTGEWARTTFPGLVRNAWRFVTTSVGGFLGIFGFLLSLVIVPIYLYYFLIESRNISNSRAALGCGAAFRMPRTLTPAIVPSVG